MELGVFSFDDDVSEVVGWILVMGDVVIGGSFEICEMAC